MNRRTLQIPVVALLTIAGLTFGYTRFDKFPEEGLAVATASENSSVQDLIVHNRAGMQLMVIEENTYPTLRIVLPGQPTSDRAIEIIFPEHVTVRPHGR